MHSWVCPDEENADMSSGRFFIVFVITPGDGQLQAVVANRTNVDLKAVHMRRVFVSCSASLDPEKHCHHRRMGILELPPG
jgi:hypothetical protein